MTANKRTAIRNTLDRLGMQAKPEQLVEALESHGKSNRIFLRTGLLPADSGKIRWRRTVPKNFAGDQEMTTTRILKLLPLAALCLLFTSCFDSKVPLSDPGKSKADERLAGSWRGRNDDGSVNDYRFARAGGKLPASVMRLTGSNRKPDGTIEQFEPLLLFPTTIGEKTYLNACDGKEQQVKLLEEKGWTGETVTAYSIFRYQVTGDKMTVQWMDGDAKKRAIESGKIKGKIEKDQYGNDRAHFTDTTENLVKFIAAAGDDLFSKDGLKLERVK